MSDLEADSTKSDDKKSCPTGLMDTVAFFVSADNFSGAEIGEEASKVLPFASIATSLRTCSISRLALNFCLLTLLTNYHRHSNLCRPHKM